MRLLFVLNELPYPMHRNGVALINYQLLKHAPAEVEIDLLIADEADFRTEKELRALAPAIRKVTYVGSEHRRWLQIANLFSGAVFGANFFEKKSVRTYFSNSLSDYDLVYAAPLMTYFRLTIRSPIFLNAVDFVSRLNLTTYETSGRIFDLLKQKLYGIYEKKVLPSVKVASFVSNVDVEFVQKICKTARVTCLSNGVDTGFFYPEGAAREPKSILFTGNFGYQPNADAAVYLAKEIFPKLRAVSPDLTLYIVGREPPGEVIGIPGVITTGFVEDIREYYRKCAVFVSPLRSGAGVKNKILEAMACGIPIVASKLSIDGIVGMQSGMHYLEASSAADFARAISGLLESPAQQQSLSTSALSLVVDKMQWQSVVRDYYSEFERAANVRESKISQYKD